MDRRQREDLDQHITGNYGEDSVENLDTYPLTFEGFSATNRTRCESPAGFNHTLDSWSLSDWMTATMGELGEAANIAKKLNRIRDGIPGNKETESELRAAFKDEIADVFIYLDLLAQSQGIDLAEAVRSKFNRTSQKLGCPIMCED